MSTIRTGRGTRSSTRWVLFVLFVVVPLVEVYVLVQVGQVIGAWWTIALLVLDSLIGSWLIKREGGRAWSALRTALQQGRVPAREIADGGLVLVGGTLMLTPGFVTDVLGILLIVPLTRPFFRRLLTRVVADRLVVLPVHGTQTQRRPGPGGSVVQGEVVEEP